MTSLLSSFGLTSSTLYPLKTSTRNPPTKEISDPDFLFKAGSDVLAPGNDNVAQDLRRPAYQQATDDTKEPYISADAPLPAVRAEYESSRHPTTTTEEVVGVIEGVATTATVSREELLTTNQGVVVADNDNSLRMGPRGPILLADHILREKITHFDHERIPERVVHARGSGVYGHFTCTRAMGEFTSASFLDRVGKTTPTFVRFSQVVGNKGSADTVRDVRGFATKFYTDDGNYDLVGNNIPIFFIQDGIKFPDLVHAIKPQPDSDMPQASAAHDNFWDFISLTPESTHIIFWLLSDIGVMRSYRTMEGAGVHAFKFINARGRVHFVKFHWRPVLGVETMTWTQAQRLAGLDPDYLRRDLWEAIKRGQFPEYIFAVQLMPLEREHDFEFDPLDPTKVWDEARFPLMECGRMVLDRNPSNHFAEVEQVTFHPGHLVPGIDLTDDPLLQVRLFSYLDTQLRRVGPNFAELPINRPLVPVHNNQRDGFARMHVHHGSVNYEPNTRAKGRPLPADKAVCIFARSSAASVPPSSAHSAPVTPVTRATAVSSGTVERYPLAEKMIACLSMGSFSKGEETTASGGGGTTQGLHAQVHDEQPIAAGSFKTRSRAAKFADHWSQARTKYRMMTPKQKTHLIKAFHFELGHVFSLDIRRRMIDWIAKVDSDLAKQVAAGLVLS